MIQIRDRLLNPKVAETTSDKVKKIVADWEAACIASAEAMIALRDTFGL